MERNRSRHIRNCFRKRERERERECEDKAYTMSRTRKSKNHQDLLCIYMNQPCALVYPKHERPVCSPVQFRVLFPPMLSSIGRDLKKEERKKKTKADDPCFIRRKKRHASAHSASRGGIFLIVMKRPALIPFPLRTQKIRKEKSPNHPFLFVPSKSSKCRSMPRRGPAAVTRRCCRKRR